MRRAMPMIRAKLKAALDRRYITRSDLLSINQSTIRLSKDVERCSDMLGGLVNTVDEVRSSLAGLAAQAPRKTGQPAELVAETRRLVHECADSIELLLQADVIIKRDLDSLRSSIDSPALDAGRCDCSHFDRR